MEVFLNRPQVGVEVCNLGALLLVFRLRIRPERNEVALYCCRVRRRTGDLNVVTSICTYRNPKSWYRSWRPRTSALVHAFRCVPIVKGH